MIKSLSTAVYYSWSHDCEAHCRNYKAKTVSAALVAIVTQGRSEDERKDMKTSGDDGA